MKSLAIAFVLLLPCVVFAQAVSLDCRVQYQKDGEIGHRPVLLGYDKGKLLAVKIDGQPVYRFTANNKSIFTSMDSERIQIEFLAKSIVWRSNLRDISLGNGLCIRAPS